MENTKTIFNIFSGCYYEIPEKDLGIIDETQIPLLKKPNQNCKSCYGRGYSGKTSYFYYNVCKCVKKVIDFENLKKPDDLKNSLKI